VGSNGVNGVENDVIVVVVGEQFGSERQRIRWISHSPAAASTSSQ
jgi:hypothetical protein